MKRPPSIETAIWLLYSLIGAGITFGAFRLISEAGTRWPRFWMFWLPALLLAGLGSTVVHAAGRRKRWARIALLVFVALQVPRFVVQAIDAFPLHLFSAWLWLCPVVIEAIAVWLLFTPESSRWYRAFDEKKNA